MKNILFGTTALVAASFAGAAHAQFELSIGGFMNAGVGVGAYSEGTATNADVHKDFHIIRESELLVVASSTLDNGISVAVRAEIDLSDSNTGDSDGIVADELSMIISGSFGRVEIGSNDNAYTIVGAPMVFDTGYTFVPGEIGTGDAAGDSMGIQYYTPAIAGFTAGVSYQPSTAEVGDVDSSTDADNTEDYVAARLGYSGAFGDVDLAVGGAFGYGDITGNNGNSETIWTVGASLGFGGFSLNGAFEERSREDGAGGDDTKTTYGGDIGYATGPWSFALGVAMQNAEDDSANTEEDRFRVGFAAGYELGEGVDLIGRVDYGDYDAAGTTSDAEGFSGSLVLGVSF